MARQGYEPKPLPSVDLALLPHELRAARARQTTVAVVLGAGALVALWALFGESIRGAFAAAPAATTGSAWPSEVGSASPVVVATSAAVPAAVDPAPPAAPPSEPANEPPVDRTPGRRAVPFGAATSFRAAVASAGIDSTDAEELVTALEAFLDFRRCRPEHELIFERDDAGTLVSFEYKLGPTQSFIATRQGSAPFAAEAVKIEVEHRRVARGGYVAGSLGRALADLGLGRALVGAFVEAFEGKIDFAKSSRSGDAFRIIVDEEWVDGTFLGHGTVHALEYTGQRVGKHRAFWFEPEGRRGEFHDARGRATQGGWLRTPLRYDRISSGFNPRRRHPILKRIVPHQGVDYAAAPGTTVWAAADGTVRFAGERGANGKLVALQHERGHETFYAHLSSIARDVKPGVKVTQRQRIGTVGSTGRSTGPHLHFALKRNGRFIDPKKELNGPGRPLPASLMPRFRTLVASLERDLSKIELARAPAVAVVENEPEETDDEFHEEPLDL